MIIMKISGEKPGIPKVPTGIPGLDDITFGGLPEGRPTLVTGYAGCGKTVFAMQFVLNGIVRYGESGVYISLEEGETDLRQNMASLGYHLEEMEQAGRLHLETITLKHSALYRSGHFDLSPIFLRIEEAVNKVGAKRLAIDTFELIFNDIEDENIFRQELARLIRWLKERELTVVFSSELPRDPRIRGGVNEFITDCVIHLKQEVLESVYTRRLHIVKYRGSEHGTNEYPFLIDRDGISVLPITSSAVPAISEEVTSTGIKGLDERIEKGGFHAGSSILVSGKSGAGKTSFAFSLCVEAIKQGKRSMFFTFEESPRQLKRNLKSIGFDLEQFEREGLLRIISTRSAVLGLEAHLVKIYKTMEEFRPSVVAFDPVTDLVQVGSKTDVREMLLRIIDSLKSRLVTILLTAVDRSAYLERNHLDLSTLSDSWVHLDMVREDGSWNKTIRIVKIRGMDHPRSEFLLEFTKDGLMIRDMGDLLRDNSQRK